MSNQPNNLPTGLSVAGIETCIELPNQNIGFDIGRCTESSVHLKHIAISHGHMDHIGALLQHASRRQLLKLGAATYYIPVDIAEHVENLFKAASRLDGEDIDYNLMCMEPGETLDMTPYKKIQAFRTYHRVASLGYRIIETRKRLKAEFKDAKPTELQDMAKRGIKLNEPYTSIPVAYTGDTTVRVLDEQHQMLKDAEMLVMEMTFMDDGEISPQQAQARGHVHMKELVDRQDMLTNKQVVLTHFSARYDKAKIFNMVVEKFNHELRQRITLL